MLSGYTTSSDSLGPPSQGHSGGVAPEAAGGQGEAREKMRRLIPAAIVLAIVAAGGAGAWYRWQQHLNALPPASRRPTDVSHRLPGRYRLQAPDPRDALEQLPRWRVRRPSPGLWAVLQYPSALAGRLCTVPCAKGQSNPTAIAWPGQARLPQSVEKCLYHLEVSRVEPFGEAVVDRLKERQRLCETALVAQQPSEARRGAQFPG